MNPRPSEYADTLITRPRFSVTPLLISGGQPKVHAKEKNKTGNVDIENQERQSVYGECEGHKFMLNKYGIKLE